MEWYVLNYDINSKKVISFNVFWNIKFKESVEELVENFITFDDFVEKLKREIKYYFCSKREYEISVGDLFYKEEELEKWDVGKQLIPNIKVLAEYIINCHNSK